MRFCAKLLLLLLLVSSAAYADTLQGTLLDASGNRVAGARVTVCSTGSTGNAPCAPALQTTFTASDGTWFVTIASGTYDVSFDRAGLTASKLTNVLTSNVPPPALTAINTGALNSVVLVDGTIYAKTDVGIQAALAAAGAGTVFLGPGTYNLSNPITMTTTGQHLICAGIKSTTLNYVSTTNITAIIDVGTAADGTNNLWNISINNCSISGNSHVTDAIRTRGVHHSDFSHNSFINFTEAGIHTNFAVLDTFNDIHTSVNEQAFTQQPASCLIFDGPDSGHQTTSGTVSVPICEGVSGTGFVLSQAATMKFIAGTSESNNKGATVSATSVDNSFEGTDTEANTTADFEITGSKNAIKTATSTKLIHIFSGAVGTIVSGGNLNSVTVDSGASNTLLEKFGYNNSSTGVITDNGTNTSKVFVFNTSGSVLDANVFGGPLASLKVTNLWLSNTAPTISPASGFNTGAVSQVNGTAEFLVTVGTGAANNTGTISLPTATNGWHCSAENQTRADLILQTANTTTTSVLTNFGTTFTATNWTNSDVLLVKCGAR